MRRRMNLDHQRFRTRRKQEYEEKMVDKRGEKCSKDKNKVFQKVDKDFKSTRLQNWCGECSKRIC